MLRGPASLLLRLAQRAPLARASLPLLAAYAPEAFRSERSARGLHIFAKTTASHDEFTTVKRQASDPPKRQSTVSPTTPPASGWPGPRVAQSQCLRVTQSQYLSVWVTDLEGGVGI